MLRLTQQPLPPHLVPFLAPLPSHFGALKYVSRAGGPGPWSSLLGPFDDSILNYMFDDDAALAAMEALGTKARRKISNGINAIFKHYQAIEGEDIAVILRQHAYLVISAWSSGAHQYVPMPGVSGHELLADQARLPLEFPGAIELV